MNDDETIKIPPGPLKRGSLMPAVASRLTTANY